MNRIRPFAIVIAALFALGAASFAQAQQAGSAEAAVEISQIDLEASTLTVQIPDGSNATYAVDATTRITNGSQRIALKDLQMGWRVVVHAEAGSRVNASAKSIEVVGFPVP